MNAKELTLRIVRLDDVLLHEQIEKKRVERLVQRIRQDQFLKNPPIVTEFGNKYILLDGATRVTALRQIGCCDVVVQIVDYEGPGISLETWNHMLLDLPVDELFSSLRVIPNLSVEPANAPEAEAELMRRESIGTLMLKDGRTFSLRVRGQARLDQQAHLLNEVVAAYDGRGEMYRVARTDVEGLVAENGRLSALVVFPRYRPDEIRQLASNGSKLPMGVTRHIIPGRAMRLNIPLDQLFCGDSIERKNVWLDEWMTSRLRERQVRYYQEPVFLFDE
ncbi:MAG: hypothetical protein M1482_01435 [Chloroflexi bacterium]|nr:hypothetical protein [Chloroflexota bacterium]